MHKNNHAGAIAGIAAMTVAAGIAAHAINTATSAQKRKMKKTAQKAAAMAGDALESAIDAVEKKILG